MIIIVSSMKISRCAGMLNKHKKTIMAIKEVS